MNLFSLDEFVYMELSEWDFSGGMRRGGVWGRPKFLLT